MYNSKFFISIFAIFLSLFFLTGCFEKQEDVKGKKNVKTAETQSKEKESKKDDSIVNATNETKLKEGLVVRPGGYGFILPIF